MNFKTYIKEARGKIVKVPKFRTGEQAIMFMKTLGPDDLPVSDVIDPETGEVLMQNSVSGQLTKRKQGKKYAKKEREWQKKYGNQTDYVMVDDESGVSDFEKQYNVVKKDLDKLLTKSDIEMLTKGDYDVYYNIPRAIARKDGKPFDEIDVENINSYLDYKSYQMANIKLDGFIKVDKSRKVKVGFSFI